MFIRPGQHRHSETGARIGELNKLRLTAISDNERLRRALSKEMAENRRSLAEIVEKTGVSHRLAMHHISMARRRRVAAQNERGLPAVSTAVIKRLTALDHGVRGIDSDLDDVEAAVDIHRTFLAWRHRYVVQEHLAQTPIDDLAKRLQVTREVIIELLKTAKADGLIP